MYLYITILSVCIYMSSSLPLISTIVILYNEIYQHVKWQELMKVYQNLILVLNLQAALV